MLEARSACVGARESKGKARRSFATRFQHRFECTGIQMRTQHILPKINDAEPATAVLTVRSLAPPGRTTRGPLGSMRTTSPSRSNSQVGVTPLANCPRRHAWESRSRGCCGRPWPRDRRALCRREALQAGTDGDGDHIFRQPLVIADAGIAACGENIDEAILDHDRRHGYRGKFARNAERMGGRTVRATPAGTLSRSVPVGRSRNAFSASRAASISREQRRESLDQTNPGFGGCDTAGGAVEQANAQCRLESPNGGAQAGGRYAAFSRGIAKTAGAGDGEKGGQIIDLDCHCSIYCTDRPN